MYQKPAPEKSTDMSDDEPDIDIEKLLKNVELFGNYMHYRRDVIMFKLSTSVISYSLRFQFHSLPCQRTVCVLVYLFDDPMVDVL